MGLTCSQSTPRTKPHLLFGETSPPSIPSLPPARIAAISFFQLPSSTCPAVASQSTQPPPPPPPPPPAPIRGGNIAPPSVCNVHLYYYVTSTKPLAAGRPSPALPSFPTDMQGSRRAAALSRQSARLVLALPSEDLFFSRSAMLALALYLTA